MTTILGLDVATSCGMGWVTPGGDPSKWRAIALEAIGDDVWDKIEDFDFDFRCQIADGPKIDFAIIERPLDVVKDYGAKKPKYGRLAPGTFDDVKAIAGDRNINATTTITLAGMAGNAIGVLNSLGIPYGLIRSQTWRKAYFGSGVKPDGKWDKATLGPKPEKWSEDWKDLAVRHARLQKIILPNDKKSAKDAAEAIGMAVAWRAVNHIPPRHQHAFMQLRMGNPRS